MRNLATAVLVEARESIKASKDLSKSMEQTLAEANRFTASLEKLKNPDGKPLDLQEVNAAVVSATKGVRELQAALNSANELVSTLASDEQDQRLSRVLDDGQATVSQLIDRLFYRGLMLVGALTLGLLLVAVIHRRMPARGSEPSTASGA